MLHIKQSTASHMHFWWISEMENELTHIKKVVRDLLPLAPFNPQHRSYIYVDAAFSGLGCVLIREDDNNQTRFVMAASSGITLALSRYSVYKLELTALAWSLEKNSYYLSGDNLVNFNQLCEQSWSIEPA